MEISESVRTCFNKYVDFNGRASRSEYWWFILASCMAFIVAIIIDQAAFGSPSLLYLITFVGLILPGLSVQSRRLHDTGRSGWWMFIALVPLVGGIVLTVWCCLKGDPDSNPYGEPPTASVTPARAKTSNDLSRLERLHDLHEKGALTAEEFAAEKAKLLG